jgi:hypothetical protein
MTTTAPSSLEESVTRAIPAAPQRRRALARLNAGTLVAVAAGCLPVAFTLFFAFNEGGYPPGIVGLGAVELALFLAICLAVVKVPWSRLTIPLVLGAVALGGFAAWTRASAGWSDSAVRATIEYDRVLLYLLALVVFGVLGFSARRARWMVYGLAAAIVGICGAAFVYRAFPGTIDYSVEIMPDRLSYPLGYWNSLGVLAAIGIVLCGHLACSVRDSAAVRILGAASMPVLAVTLYYTFSRGGTWAAVVGVALYCVVGRPRGLITGGLAMAPPTLMALMAANPATALTRDPTSDAAVAAGHDVATTVIVAVVAAGVLRALLVPVDARLERIRLPDRLRKPVVASAVCILVIGSTGAALAAGVPGIIEEKYTESKSEDAVWGSGSSRLLAAGSNGRREHWDVALASFREAPRRGSGAGTYALTWWEKRERPAEAQDGHSLYLEVLGELGWPGMAMLGLTLLLILGSFAFRARGQERPLFAALLAAGVVWALHAAVDWDWEMPAVTFWLFAFGGLALAAGPRGEARQPRRAVVLPVKALLIAGALALAVGPGKMAVSDDRVGAATDSIRRGDCRAAIAHARDSLSALSNRAVPYQVIGFCEMRLRRPDAAVVAYTQALRHDPHNPELLFNRGIALATAGRDPRRDLKRAVRANPTDPQLQAAHARLRGSSPRAWRRGARATAAEIPGAPTP